MALEIRFFGMVGSDQCSRLSRVEKTKTAGQLTIRFLAERPCGHCLQMPVMLEHLETVPPPLTDPFTITVILPGGLRLVRTVRIQ